VRIISWFEHHIRWVLITALGSPVDPDVNRNLAIVSPVTASRAASTAADAGAGGSPVAVA